MESGHIKEVELHQPGATNNDTKLNKQGNKINK